MERSAETAWRTHAGADRADRLRTALKSTVAALPLEYAHYPARYGAADASVTGGNGVDWKPVSRGSGDTASGLCLSALTSQALVAFAIAYEERSPVALSLSASVIRRIPHEAMPLQGLDHAVDVSALPSTNTPITANATSNTITSGSISASVSSIVGALVVAGALADVGAIQAGTGYSGRKTDGSMMIEDATSTNNPALASMSGVSTAAVMIALSIGSGTAIAQPLIFVIT